MVSLKLPPLDPSIQRALFVIKAYVDNSIAAIPGGGGGGVTAHSALTGLTVGNDHTQYQLSSAKGAASGYASLDASVLVPIAQIPTGTTGTTVTVGNDSRLSNARTPTAHVGTHSDIGTDPIIMGGDLTGGANSAVIATNAVSNTKLAQIATATIKGRTTAGTGNVEDLTPTQGRTVLGLGGAALLAVGTTAGTVAAGDDSRMTNARTPTAHVGTHSDVGSDPIIMGGDLTGGANSAIVGANKVGNAKLATMATSQIKGRATAGTGNVEDLTAAQVSTILGLGTAATTNATAYATAAQGTTADGAVQKSVATTKGDLFAATGSAVVTRVPVGTPGQFLKADPVASNGVSWATLAGGGDLLASNNLSELTATATTARGNIGVGNVGTLTSPGTTTTFLRGDATFVVPPKPVLYNSINAAVQTLPSGADTYVTYSNLTPGGRQQAGTLLKWVFGISKTAAGTAAPIFTMRWGTAGTVADAQVFQFTGPVQTAVADSAQVIIEVVFYNNSPTVGQFGWTFQLNHNLATTGFANIGGIGQSTSSGTSFATNSATSIAGISINTGASAVWTMRYVSAEAINLT